MLAHLKIVGQSPNPLKFYSNMEHSLDLELSNFCSKAFKNGCLTPSIAIPCPENTRNGNIRNSIKFDMKIQIGNMYESILRIAILNSELNNALNCLHVFVSVTTLSNQYSSPSSRGPLSRKSASATLSAA